MDLMQLAKTEGLRRVTLDAEISSNLELYKVLMLSGKQEEAEAIRFKIHDLQDAVLDGISRLAFEIRKHYSG